MAILKAALAQKKDTQLQINQQPEIGMAAVAEIDSSFNNNVEAKHGMFIISSNTQKRLTNTCTIMFFVPSWCKEFKNMHRVEIKRAVFRVTIKKGSIDFDYHISILNYCIQ